MSMTSPASYDIARLDSVRRKRFFAFLIDFTFVCILWLLACAVVLLLGVFTLGLAWLLYGAVFPVVAVLYSGISIANRGATPGMRAMGLVFRLESGAQPDFLQGAVHVILFYVSVTFLTPLVLIVSLFNARKRLLHDMLIGATVENA